MRSALLLVALLSLPCAAEEPARRLRVELGARPPEMSPEEGAVLAARVAEVLSARLQSPLAAAGASVPGAVVDTVEVGIARRGRILLASLAVRRDIEGEVIARAEELVFFSEALAAAIADRASGMLTPVGRVVRGVDDAATLQFGAPIAFDLKNGTTFRVLRRRRGQARGVALQLSFFVAAVATPEAGVISGKLVSSAAPSAIETDAIEEFAAPLALTSTAPVRLRVIDRQDRRPLAGYQVFERGAKAAEYRGVTDADGRFAMRLAEPRLTELELRFNELVLTRLLVAPAPEVGVIEVALRGRTDQSPYHRELNRIINELEELVLLREVAIEDIAAEVGARRFDQAEKIIEGFKPDAARAPVLRRKMEQIRARARAEGQDIAAVVNDLLSQFDAAARRLDMTLFEAELLALRDRVAARKKAEAYILAANAALADQKFDAAIKILQKSVLADPTWELPKERLAELTTQWRVQSPEHRKARELVLSVEGLDPTALKAKLPELRAALTTLKGLRDGLTLRAAARGLTAQLGRLNEEARRALDRSDAAAARPLTSLALELGPIIDEATAFLKAN